MQSAGGPCSLWFATVLSKAEQGLHGRTASSPPFSATLSNMEWLPFLHGSQPDSRISTEALDEFGPLGALYLPPGRTIPRLASNIPPIKCFTSPNQTLKSESSCPLNSSRGLTASFNFLVQRNWNSSWVLCMAVMILAINCWQRDGVPHPSRFWLE